MQGTELSVPANISIQILPGSEGVGTSGKGWRWGKGEESEYGANTVYTFILMEK
jgi:hypothetical protein